MKTVKIVLLCLTILMGSSPSYSQDKRLTATKVADLLARFPANDLQLNNKLMGDMLSLGETGLKQICDQVIPASTGDDTSARYAIESFSRFLSQKGKENEKSVWEALCINYAIAGKDNGVKDLFMKQLQIIGGEKSADAMKQFLGTKESCEPALAVIVAVGGKDEETILAEALKNKDLPCATAAMNALAKIKSAAAVNEYIMWAANKDVNIRASAYNALAQSGNSAALPVLSKAALDAAYGWEPTGAVAALLTYAKSAGDKGDFKTADKICRLIISKCNDSHTIQNKTEALYIFVSLHGISAMPEILTSASNPDKQFRNAAMRISLAIKDKEVVSKWIKFFPKAIPEARPEIISMLGLSGDETTLPLIKASLADKDVLVRESAADAIVKINGNKSLPELLDYMKNYSSDDDQAAAKKAIMTVIGSISMPHLLPLLKDGSASVKKSVIELLAWNRDNKSFAVVLPFTSANTEDVVKEAAFKALPDLAGPGDIENLISLIGTTENQSYIQNVQIALAAAAGQVSTPEKRSTSILSSVQEGRSKEKLIPVLARTGGHEALVTVMKEFGNGNSQMRDLCFKTLTEWCDYSASSALYDICASGNKTFEAPAFEGYVKQIKAAQLPDEQKLLLLRKIMPFALSTERKNSVLSEIGKLRTYQALYFVAQYLDDPSTSATAAMAARQIALPSSNSKAGMYGSMVKEILLKAIDNIKGPESEYDKEMMRKYLSSMSADEGFKPMFNGKDLTGWQGLVENPVARAKMKPKELAKKQIEANKKVAGNWSVKDGCIWFNGNGENLCSVKEYGDFEMMVDWKITKAGDSGIYLRGSPQVQIWDTSRVEVGAQVGSGGLYNNQKNPSKPPKVADNPVGDWNTFRIIMTGEKVSVWLNGVLVVDNVTLENYWDRNIPIFPTGPVELQAHGTDLEFRDVYIREISEKEFNLTAEEKADGFEAVFNGKNLDNWIGDKVAYRAEDGMVVIKPGEGSGGNLYTEKEYSDFVVRFEFLLTPAANNGIGIRAPLTGDAAYVGMEIQVLDDTAPVYASLQPYQYHGSVYGVIPARRGFQKPVGEWNYEEIRAQGSRITVTLNGTVIVDGDIAGPRDNGTMDHNNHPGLKNASGHIGFLGHGSEVKFRNIRVKDLTK